MNGIPDWDTLVEEPIRKGQRLELCWRSGSKLDWVWLEHDEEGRDRPWAVLWGVASANVSVAFCCREGGLLISFLQAPRAIRLGAANRRTLAYKVCSARWVDFARTPCAGRLLVSIPARHPPARCSLRCNSRREPIVRADRICTSSCAPCASHYSCEPDPSPRSEPTHRHYDFDLGA